MRERPTPPIDKEMYKKLQIRLPKDQQAKGNTMINDKEEKNEDYFQ